MRLRVEFVPCEPEEAWIADQCNAALLNCRYAVDVQSGRCDDHAMLVLAVPMDMRGEGVPCAEFCDNVCEE